MPFCGGDIEIHVEALNGSWWKVEMPYVLVLLLTFLAELNVRFAVDDLPEVFGCVLLVCDLPAEKVAGLRWVREGIGRIDLPGESLIQRRHRVGPVEAKQLRACHGHRRLSPDSVFYLVLLLLRAFSRRTDGRQPDPSTEQKAKDAEPRK